MPHAAGLYYETHGAPDAPPLILSAGLGGSASYWTPNIAALARHFRVIGYDHRGTGRSDRGLPHTVTVEDLADDILALMDALAIPRAHLVGHAAGGVAGLALALKAPQRLTKLVVVNGFASADPHFVRCFETRLALLRDSGPRAYLRAQPIFLYPAVFISEMHAFLDHEETQQLANFAGVETYEKRIAALLAFDVSERLGEITVPTVAIASEDDMLVPYHCSERLTQGIPQAELAMMRWGGHACNFTNMESFDRLLHEILED